MNFVDWFGRWFGSGGTAFAETIDESIDRANVRFMLPSDSALYLGARSRTAINEKVEWLWQNFGIVKEGVAGIARHTVGKGIPLDIESDDPEFNIEAGDDFESFATTAERCDLAGRRTFYEAQVTGVEQRIHRGEFFSAKTENPEWENEPCFQLYDSQEIESPMMAPIQGKTIIDGVTVNAATRATGYWVRGLDGSHSEIPRERMIHWMKGHAINQVRGISDLAQSVNPMVDIHELKRLATRSAKAQQLIALVLKGISKKKGRGAFGALKNASPTGTEETGTDTAQLEKLVGAAGAGIAYLDEKGEAQLITPNSPSPLVEGFITDLLMRDVCSGWGVPSEFFWNIAKLGGANTRFVLSKADLLFQILADGLIYRFCTPVAYRYLKHRIDIGAIRTPSDKNWHRKLTWQTPARVTVDNGKDGALLIELLANGMITLREYCNHRGLNYRQTMRQWIREPLEFVVIAKREIAKEKELSPEEGAAMLKRWVENMPLWRAAKPGAAAPTEQSAKPDEDDTAKAA